MQRSSMKIIRHFTHSFKVAANKVFYRKSSVLHSTTNLTTNLFSEADAEITGEYAYSSGSLITALDTKTLDTNLFICENWVVSIDLKLTEQSTTKWSNIFSLQLNSSVEILALWVRPNQSHLALLVDYNLNNTIKHSFNASIKFNIDNWLNVRVSQVNEVFEIKVDYRQVHNITNFTAETWRYVNIVTGNINETEILAVAQYRNFDIVTCAQLRKIIKFLTLFNIFLDYCLQLKFFHTF